MISRRKYWREVQPVFQSRLGPSKAGIFKPPSAAHNAPIGPIYALPEAPAVSGWWSVKYPTARKPFLRYFTDADIREMEGLQEDGMAFYPWTPTTRP